MKWFTAVARVLLFIAAGTLVGLVFGHALVGTILATSAVVLYWLQQMWLVEHWLRDSSQAPPNVHGLWAELVGHIYRQERNASATISQLQSTVDYLLQSFAAMRDGVVILEDGGAIRWCNDAVQPLLGLRYPEDTGQAITNLVRVPEFKQYLQAGDYTTPLVFERGGEPKTHLMLVATRFAEGDILLFVRNVTDRVQNENMRRDFVGNVSHELRTPLTVITGYLGTMLADTSGLPPPYVRALEQMDGQASRMENLLKDLLWLTRIETTERDAKDEQVDMGALLAELQDEMGNLHPDNPLQLQVECQERIPGDYRELYSAVSNLVINAYKYGGQGKPVIASWRKQGEDYHLAVRDHGRGIDPVHIPRLTERFYRVDDSRSSMTGGTGLGLAIVKHVAMAHGGRLNIESRAGQGSTFTIILPQRT
ncbi:phosphate regulon sensor histidine kinase PhoR [Mangrovimicrobium sediminis]|uniref:Phosphate regulon sensor protein PhoR n=1 Tax=Mangrovimicrobium sediminis TaxID=2562682 RepID=A0A4Z0M724_9GAMM|nr:phosphate regulon sensor histidine kinase PhoR [Haliea sp. SAOS-164]TGD75208.1 phosphate regulon sensor histidine kinase PhoR [Haliea sp. SAOS-164]